MWRWIRAELLRRIGWRALQPRSSGTGLDPKKSGSVAGTTGPGWVRLLGTVAA